jgi:hypothetical protein
MFDTDRLPPRRQDLDSHAAPAPVAKPWWFQDPRPFAFGVVGAAIAIAIAIAIAVVEAGAAPVAPARRGHSVADSALTGIDSSANSARSALAGRPSVVR